MSSLTGEAAEIRNFSKIMFVILLFFLVLGFTFESKFFVFAQTDHLASDLQGANSAVGQAFNAILDAEKAGGNVTNLLAKLNTAGTILATAQNALNSNTENITSNVENVIQMANQVNDDAINLRNVSLVQSQNSLWLTLTFSFVGAGLLSLSLLFFWRRFKRTFIKKLLETKPEVVDNES